MRHNNEPKQATAINQRYTGGMDNDTARDEESMVQVAHYMQDGIQPGAYSGGRLITVRDSFE